MEDEMLECVADDMTVADWEAFAGIMEQPVSGDLIHDLEDLEIRAAQAIMDSDDLLTEATGTLKGWDVNVRGMNAEDVVNALMDSYGPGIVKFYMDNRRFTPATTRK